MPTPCPINTAHHTAPIGIFDSGVGGLSVYLHLHHLLPNETFIYYADTKNVPYGEKSPDEIVALSKQAVQFLADKGCKLVVVACNSASAYALQELRASFAMPIVGLVPAIKPACQLTKSKKVAVLATKATLTSNALAQVIDAFATPQDIDIYKHFEPRLVPWVESGMPIDSEVANLLIKQMHTWLDYGVDTLVLGCTHYPFFKDFLQENIEKNQYNIKIIDSGLAIAQRVAFLLKTHKLATTATNHPSPICLYASNTQQAAQTLVIAERLIGRRITLCNNTQ